MKLRIITKELKIVNLANTENDDWLKKANPNYRMIEAEAHAKAAKLHSAG